jgi:predicted AAA+ superfamily ATPase
MDSYHSRTIEDAWERASRQFPILLLTGPRQVGKTTVLRHLAGAERSYVTLDDLALRDLARRDPVLFLQRFQAPLLIDEIQYAPELLPYLKMRVDEAQLPGMYWLTGSQQYHLMQGVTESLAGRVAVVNLLGFSAREADGRPHRLAPFLPTPEGLATRAADHVRKGAPEVFADLWRGQYPALAVGRIDDVELYYRSYVQTYLERDVRDLVNVGDLETFRRFLRAAAARTAQLLNYTELARDTGVSLSTARHWLSVLVASGQVHLLQPYHTNVTRRLCKTPKLYFLDTGLCAYLTEWRTPETLEAGAMAGAIFETAVVAEILKSWWHRLREAPAYFYRDSNRYEVDLCMVSDGRLYPVEIKRAGTVSERDIRLSALQALPIEIGPAAIVCLAPQPLPLSRNVEVVPFGML